MMRIRKIVLSTLAVALIATPLVLSTLATATEQQLVRLSEEGHDAVRAISLARVVIFEGQPQEAAKLVEKAKTALSAASKDADNLAIKPQAGSTDKMIPINARLTLADDFILTPEKKELVDKVNEHLKKGDAKRVLEVLQPSDINLILSTAFLPLEAATKAVDEAAKLIADGKYYEANLALKKAEDGIVVDAQGFHEYLDAMPKAQKSDKPAQ